MKTPFVLLMLFVAINVFSQTPFGTSKEKLKENKFHIELIAGAITPSMQFKNTLFDDFEQKTVVDKMGGLALRINLNEILSFSTQVNYRSASISIPEFNEYHLQTHYINLFTPLELNCNIYKRKRKSGKCLFFYGGPYFAANLGGEMSSRDYSLTINADQIAPYDYGLEVGLGIRVPTYTFTSKSNISIKASYMYGLANTFPISSSYSIEELSNYLISIDGKRNIQGFLLTLTYEISVEKKTISHFTAGGNGKKTYKKFIAH